MFLCTFIFIERPTTHLFIDLFIYLSGSGQRPLRDKELSSLDDSEAGLTDMSSHLMCVAVGQSPLGPISRRQLPDGMSKTAHKSVEFVLPPEFPQKCTF